ncbi:MAG: hypothetical protein IKU52_05630 [Clostridia bacterium]|nr:hypothetical protein [Clostridia bacterium]
MHFLYEWTNKNKIAALISGTNESTWEHIKLLYIPMLVFAFIEYAVLSENHNNFWFVKLKGSVTGILLIPTLFYTLNGIFSKTPDWINISIFFVSAAVVYYRETIFFKNKLHFVLSEKSSLYILIFILLLFVIFTFKPPKLPLFTDPLTMTAGI